MADALTFSGELRSTPSAWPASGDPIVDMTFCESASLSQKTVTGPLQLISDAPVNVPFGTVTNAKVIVIKCVGGPVRAGYTSEHGTDQGLPADLHILFCPTGHPVTAINLTRSPGVLTEVRVYLGE